MPRRRGGGEQENAAPHRGPSERWTDKIQTPRAGSLPAQRGRKGHPPRGGRITFEAMER